jgi:hypothetical protein
MEGVVDFALDVVVLAGVAEKDTLIFVDVADAGMASSSLVKNAEAKESGVPRRPGMGAGRIVS